MARPRLKTHVRPLRRGPGAVQFGLTPGFGVVLEGLLPAEISLLERLDGSADLRGLYAVARNGGIARSRLDELLDTLRRHRLLVEQPTDRALLSRLGLSGRARLDLGPDADALAVSGAGSGDGYAQIAARGRYRVAVHGWGGLPEAIASLLVSTGVSCVSPAEQRAPTDAADEVGGSSGGRAGGSSGGGEGAPDLIVLTASRALPVEAGEQWLRQGVAHLPVVSLGHRVVIGPLVTPGSGPCLRCLDLHRSDRDSAWPTVLAQLVTARPDHSPAVRAETALTAVAAGLTAMVVHRRIDGSDLPPGASLEIALPWPRVDHRTWTAHPLCSCSSTTPLPAVRVHPTGAVGARSPFGATMNR